MNMQRTLAYGVMGLPLAFGALPIYVHIPRFYAQTTGMDLALLGGLLLGTRLLDAVIDPWLGWLADRVSRPIMLAVALLPFGLGFIALLNPPARLAGIWLLASLTLSYAGFSAATVAYQAWGSELGRDAGGRTRLTATREGFGLVGIVLAAALPGLLGANLLQGVARLGWVLPPLLLVGAALGFGCLGMADQRPASPRPLLPGLKRVLADPAFQRLLAVFLASGIAVALPSTLFLFFVADVLKQESASGALLALYFIAAAASLPAWVHVAGRLGRVQAWLLSMALSILAFAGAGLLGAGDLVSFSLICLFSGLALGADLALPSAMAADIGERLGQAGACFGIWNFVAKLNLALAAGLALPLLGALGYVPGTNAGLPALSLAYAALPLAFKALSGSLLWRWRYILETKP